MKLHLATGTFLLLVGVALMVYAVQELYGMPYLCSLVLAWMAFVEYALIRAWWVDVQEARVLRERSYDHTPARDQ